MIVHTMFPPSGTAAPTSADAEARPTGGPADGGGREGDPMRQLFHRHANHLNSVQVRNIHARLKHRLFADDNRLTADPSPD